MMYKLWNRQLLLVIRYCSCIQYNQSISSCSKSLPLKRKPYQGGVVDQYSSLLLGLDSSSLLTFRGGRQFVSLEVFHTKIFIFA